MLLLRAAAEGDVRAEARLVRSSGAIVPVQLSLSQIPIEQSGHAICVVATDLTAQKYVQEQVHRLNAELEKRVDVRTAELQEAHKVAGGFQLSHRPRPSRTPAAYSRLLGDFALRSRLHSKRRWPALRGMHCEGRCADGNALGALAQPGPAKHASAHPEKY